MWITSGEKIQYLSGAKKVKEGEYFVEILLGKILNKTVWKKFFKV